MKDTLQFKIGISVPSLGFGTWQITGQDCVSAVKTALKLGYKHIDTADKYGNHREVAQGIADSGAKRGDFFLTTKVWRDFLHHDEVIAAADRFLEELETEYLDLLLVHWPNSDAPIEETLGALKELQDQKKIRSFGVSNFTIPLLEEALATNIEIVNNQVEFHPSLNQKELKSFCDANKLVVTCYSPIAQGADLTLPVVEELSVKYGKTPSQIILNWLLSKQMIVIPRSSKPGRIEENLGALAFEMEKADYERMEMVERGSRVVQPPFAPFTD